MWKDRDRMEACIQIIFLSGSNLLERKIFNLKRTWENNFEI